MYAALDAYCLIEIYEQIRVRFLSMKQQVDFNEFVHGFLIENKNKISVNKKNTQGANIGSLPTMSQVRPPVSNINYQHPPKSRPQYQHRDEEKSKH